MGTSWELVGMELEKMLLNPVNHHCIKQKRGDIKI